MQKSFNDNVYIMYIMYIVVNKSNSPKGYTQKAFLLYGHSHMYENVCSKWRHVSCKACLDVNNC